MFKSIFANKPKKLFKFIYKSGYGSYADKHTLLITGATPSEAVENFYKKTKDKVSDILEFTEIKYGSEGAEVTHEQVKF
jgi:hypothetical protein